MKSEKQAKLHVLIWSFCFIAHLAQNLVIRRATWWLNMVSNEWLVYKMNVISLQIPTHLVAKPFESSSLFKTILLTQEYWNHYMVPYTILSIH